MTCATLKYSSIIYLSSIAYEGQNAGHAISLKIFSDIKLFKMYAANNFITAVADAS